MKDRQDLVGIVTFTFGLNYGCHLQRYALQRACERLGYQASSLLLSLDDLTLPENLGYLRRKRRKFRKFRQDVSQGVYTFSYFRKLRAFKRFERVFLSTTKRFHSYEQVTREAESFGFSAYIAGSDQIWNPLGMYHPNSYNYYMLAFAPSKKKIAYAPSLAVSKVSEQYEEKFQRYLSDFRYLSAREQEGADELSRILGRQVERTLDPTLLLSGEEWDVVASRAKCKIPERYILCYSLGNPTDVFYRALAIQKTLKCPIVCFEEAYEAATLKRYGHDAIFARNVGPCEFVQYVKHASCVVTDSYHGTTFSIVYERPFFTMMRDAESQDRSMNSRITTLFASLGLQSRLFDPRSESLITMKALEIDYDAVNRALQERRENSIRYLQTALSATTGDS